MEEARRFFRYVIPGLVFMIEVMATILIMYHKQIWAFLIMPENADTILGKFVVSGQTGTILGMFVVSGGLGYIFSNIYFVIYWFDVKPLTDKLVGKFKPLADKLVGKFKHLAVNHVDVIKSLSGKLIIENTAGEDWLYLNKLDKHKAWVITNMFWHTRLLTSKRIQGINTKNDQMTDITHGLGTTFVATFFAVLMYIFLDSIGKIEFEWLNFGYTFVMLIGLLITIAVQYHRAHNLSQSLVNTTFANEVIIESKNGEEPIILTFSDSE